MKRKNILIIENSTGVTGALKSIVRTALDLNFFFNFYFVVPKNSSVTETIKDHGFLNIIELPMKEISRRFLSLIVYLPYLFINAIRLKQSVKIREISVIHSNDIYNLLPIVIRLLGDKTPYVCHVRFLPDRFPYWLFNFWLNLHLRYAFKVVAVSQAVKSMLPKHSKIVMIHNELPSQEYYPYQETLDEAKPIFTFLYLSNIMDGKGQNFALEAFAEIHESLPNWKLRFVGGDMGLRKNRDYLNGLKKQAHKQNIADKVEWKEFTNDVEWEYKQADIALNFSESESFSKTCLEALYYGTPLIASDCGGPAEIVDDKVTGLLVPNRDVGKMAEAMASLANDKVQRKEMGSTARIRVRQKFSIENTSYLLKRIYEESLEQ